MTKWSRTTATAITTAITAVQPSIFLSVRGCGWLQSRWIYLMLLFFAGIYCCSSNRTCQAPRNDIYTYTQTYAYGSYGVYTYTYVYIYMYLYVCTEFAEAENDLHATVVRLMEATPGLRVATLKAGRP